MELRQKQPPKKLVAYSGLFIAACAFVACGLIAYVVFKTYPFCLDEYNYLYQAQIFAEGKRYLIAQDWQKHLLEQYIIAYRDRVFSKYPPGFSMLLAIGVKLGVPALVNPLFSAATVYLTHKSLLRLVSPLAAFLSALLLVANSYFLGYGGSYFAQPVCLLIYAGCFYCMVMYREQGNSRYVWIGSTLAGACIWVRPLDAGCILAALGLMILLKHSGRALLAGLVRVALPPLVWLLLMCAYNWSLTGCFCLVNYPVLQDEFQVVSPEAKSVVQNIQHVLAAYMNSVHENMLPVFWGFFVPFIGAPVLLLALGGLVMAGWQIRLLTVTPCLLLVVLYNFHFTPGWPQYGARYWYPAIAPIFLLVGYGMEALVRFRRELALLALLWGGYYQSQRIPFDLHRYEQRFIAKALIEKDIRYMCRGKRVVQIYTVPEPPMRENVQRTLSSFFVFGDFKRNPFFKGDHLYVYTRYTQDEVLKNMPGYSACTYEFPSIYMLDVLSKDVR